MESFIFIKDEKHLISVTKLNLISEEQHGGIGLNPSCASIQNDWRSLLLPHIKIMLIFTPFTSNLAGELICLTSCCT